MDYERPKVVISKCIGFGHCRFDGSMINSDEVEKLKKYVDFFAICPEMAIGLPAPRESLRLILVNDENRLVSTKKGIDMTDQMIDYATKISLDIRAFQPDGFILKSRSPSCGIKEVKVYNSIGKAPCINRKAKGVFGHFMMEEFPEVIFEDEGRMSNFSIREHFYTAIFTKADFNKIKAEKSMKSLVDFHGKNKYLFMAYSQNQLKILGRIVANHEKKALEEVLSDYENNLNKLLAKNPSNGKYINVMLHIFGYFSNELSASEKAFFLDSLENYRSQHIPQSTVMAILWSWLLRFNDPYLLKQTVFSPFPKELVQMTDSGKGL